MKKNNSLPESVLTKKQTRNFTRFYSEDGTKYKITVNLRYDDQCGNGHNTFSITADILYYKNGHWRDYAFGCCHEKITKHFPEYEPLIKWHGCTSEGPLYYIENTTYHVSKNDHWGLEKGEFRQHTSRGEQNGGIEGVPNWVLEIPDDIKTDIYATECPAPVLVYWKAYGITGEGKERDLDAARHCAIWPEATDNDLIEQGLEERLLKRLPGLMAEFKSVMESLGFVY